MNADGYGGGPYENDERKKLQNLVRKWDAKRKKAGARMDALEDERLREQAKWRRAYHRWLDAVMDLDKLDDKERSL